MTPDRNPVLAASCLLAALLLTLLAACGSTPAKLSPEEEEWVAIGDRIEVTEASFPDEIEADVVVQIDGTVRLPKIGFVQVAGRTRTEIEALLMERYGPYYDRLDVKVELTVGGWKYFSFDEATGVTILRRDPDDPRIQRIEAGGGRSR